MLTEPAGVPIWASLEPILETQDDAGARAQSAPAPLGTSLEVPSGGGLEPASSVEIHDVPEDADGGGLGTLGLTLPEPSSPPEPQQDVDPPGPSGTDPPHTPSSHSVWGPGTLWGSPHLVGSFEIPLVRLLLPLRILFDFGPISLIRLPCNDHLPPSHRSSLPLRILLFSFFDSRTP